MNRTWKKEQTQGDIMSRKGGTDNTCTHCGSKGMIVRVRNETPCPEEVRTHPSHGQQGDMKKAKLGGNAFFLMYTSAVLLRKGRA